MCICTSTLVQLKLLNTVPDVHMHDVSVCVSYYYSFRRKVETLDQNVEGLRGHLQQLVTIARTYCKAGNAFCEHGRELSSALMHLQLKHRCISASDSVSTSNAGARSYRTIAVETLR
eukprot:4792-Heterococcus_DN1.PRE.2